MRTSPATLTLLTALLPLTASADPDVDEAAPVLQSSAVSLGSARSQVEDRMLLPVGASELGVALRVVTAPVGPGGEGLALGDLSLLGLSGRRAVGERFEVSAGLTLLPKQPTGGDELALQGAQITGRAAFGADWAAALQVGGGPQLGGDALWGETALLAQARKRVHETMSFQGVLGASGLYLTGDDAGWIAEAVAGADVLLRVPNGFFGMYAGADYRVPVASADALDAPVRLGLSVGAVYAVVPTWDLYVEASVTDRGDVRMPETTLPILDGGRDQRQIVVGVAKHFAADDQGQPPHMMLAF